MDATKIKGLITEKDVVEVEAIFGKKIANALLKAKEGETFLGILTKLRAFEARN